MKNLTALALGIFISVSAGGANAFDLYPPGCATVPEYQTLVYGRDAVVKIYEGKVALVNARTGSGTLDARVAAYRVACSEPNRSVIWLEFSRTNRDDWYQMPVVVMDFGGGGRLGRLAREPGAVSQSEPGGQVLGGWNKDRWIYMVEEDEVAAWWDGPISAEAYNGSFELQLHHIANINRPVLRIPVPATAEVLPAPAPMPLNGRLSGNWVAKNAADQGFVLSFSELVPGQMKEPGWLWKQEAFLFLSWFTFDPDGKPLWLTGGGRYLPGDTKVTLDLTLVTDGKFMASTPATRTAAGTVELTAFSCNRLKLDYDLSPIALGNSSMHLQRLFSLEIAGFACRDRASRLKEAS
jgi:hypothetical protein